MKHLGISVPQVATDGLAVASVRKALAEHHRLRRGKAPPTVHQAMSGEPCCRTGRRFTRIASASIAHQATGGPCILFAS